MWYIMFLCGLHGCSLCWMLLGWVNGISIIYVVAPSGFGRGCFANAAFLVVVVWFDLGSLGNDVFCSALIWM